MVLDGLDVSLHDRRIEAIIDVLTEEGESAGAASGDVTRRLAARVLHAVDGVRKSARPIAAASATPTPRATGTDGDHPDLDVVGSATCPACPHPLSRHDVVDARFCRATVARALSRGCTCRGR